MKLVKVLKAVKRIKAIVNFYDYYLFSNATIECTEIVKSLAI